MPFWNTPRLFCSPKQDLPSMETILPEPKPLTGVLSEPNWRETREIPNLSPFWLPVSPMVWKKLVRSTCEEFYAVKFINFFLTLCMEKKKKSINKTKRQMGNIFATKGRLISWNYKECLQKVINTTREMGKTSKQEKKWKGSWIFNDKKLTESYLLSWDNRVLPPPHVLPPCLTTVNRAPV